MNGVFLNHRKIIKEIVHYAYDQEREFGHFSTTLIFAFKMI